MITLRSTGLLVRVDPAHGGEIIDLVDASTGRQLLGRPPFAAQPPLAGPLDEDTWVRQYRGGWQTLTPNAGNACATPGGDHGFHGTASNDPWTLTEVSQSGATLAWSGQGLEVIRVLELSGCAVSVQTTWRAVHDAAPFVSVEHISLGTEMLEPEARIRLPGGRCFELSEADGQCIPPSDASEWPDVRLLSGAVERGDLVATATPNGCFFAAVDLPEGWYEVENLSTGQQLRVEWDARVLPHLWLWREIRASGGVWAEKAAILGIEPASVPHSLGLARAVDAGQAFVLGEGERLESSVTAMVSQRAA